jgi:hypothetical protein
MINQEIHNICKEYRITNYTINQDGSIDVNGNVNLSYMTLLKLPLKFNKVSGSFYCYNSKLTSLEGCPKEIGGNFVCSNNKLTTLKGSPESVRGYFDCGDNQLTTLEGCPNRVGVYFLFNYNNLISLDGFNNSNYDMLFCDNKNYLIKKHKRSKKLKLIENLENVQF